MDERCFLIMLGLQKRYNPNYKCSPLRKTQLYFIFKEEKMFSSTNGAEHHHLFLMSYTKINSKLIKDLNFKN